MTCPGSAKAGVGEQRRRLRAIKFVLTASDGSPATRSRIAVCVRDAALLQACCRKDHPHAVRILARAWIRVIWRCWHDNTPYVPTNHGAAQALTAQSSANLAA
jgi:hypothetical protein